MTKPVKNPPEGENHLTTILTVKSIKQAVEFYTQSLGFAFFEGMKLGDDYTYARVGYHGINIVLMPNEKSYDNAKCAAPASTGSECPTSLYLYTDKLEELHNQLKAQGVEITGELTTQMWGDRTFAFKDPDGYRWMLATHVEDTSYAELPAGMEFVKA